MREVLFLLILTGVGPLAYAGLVNRRTSLAHAVTWAVLAWIGWLAAWVAAAPGDQGGAARYAALSLASCPGIAVLGARWPTVAAWDLVILGMLAIMLWPLVEAAVIGREQLGTVHLVFVAAVLAVSVANYLPTRMGPAALLAGCGAATDWLTFISSLDETGHWISGACMAAAPWLAYLTWPSRAGETAIDRLWLNFRDRYGLAWGQRVREQFNRAAGNAGWPVLLSWSGLRISSETAIEATTAGAMLDTMQGLLRRFVSTAAQPVDK
ncbi:MAG: hypothetical protein FJ271_26800 [Planctomycetes bacterium]|nr:hypothetical protein [Planctomycetota bacterium]